MGEKKFAVNEYVTSNEIKKVRRKMNLTQSEFARLTGSSKPTVERWEKEGAKVKGPIVLLVEMLKQNMDYVVRLEIPPKELPVRMWYMYKDKICTLIDVDEVKEIVRIKNYAGNVMFTAFGNIVEPDIEDYKEFLESRCFPRTRDKIKLELERLNVPFYDPYMIIQKTQGRMAEDDFWIRMDDDRTVSTK